MQGEVNGMEMKRFEGKVALVTGATRGIGRATAVRLAQEGALVGVNYRESLTPAQLRANLQQSADDLGKPGNDDFYGAGRVNALKAVLE